MKINLLVESMAQVTSHRTIYGVEIAGAEQNLSGRDPVSASIQTISKVVTSGVTSVVPTVESKVLSYVAVTITSSNPLYTNISSFINNYDQFYLNGTNSIVSSANYDPTINRYISALDERYPYANTQLNTAGIISSI